MKAGLLVIALAHDLKRAEDGGQGGPSSPFDQESSANLPKRPQSPAVTHLNNDTLVGIPLHSRESYHDIPTGDLGRV